MTWSTEMEGQAMPIIPSNMSSTKVFPGCLVASANVWFFTVIPATLREGREEEREGGREGGREGEGEGERGRGREGGGREGGRERGGEGGNGGGKE